MKKIFFLPPPVNFILLKFTLILYFFKIMETKMMAQTYFNSVVATPTPSDDVWRGGSVSIGNVSAASTTCRLYAKTTSNSPYQGAIAGDAYAGVGVGGNTQNGVGVWATSTGVGDAFYASAFGAGRAGVFYGAVQLNLPTDGEHLIIGDGWHFYNDDNAHRCRMGYNVTASPVGDLPINSGVGTTAMVFTEYGNIDIQNGPQGATTVPPITMSIQNTGKVLIGDVAAMNGNTNGSYLLYVQQGIISEKVKVAAYGNWPDYVFSPTYKLPELAHLKTYLDSEKHLPNLPSACEIAEEGGIELGEMTRLQQEKIEEIYLYLIQLSEKIAALEAENKALKSPLTPKQ